MQARSLLRFCFMAEGKRREQKVKKEEGQEGATRKGDCISVQDASRMVWWMQRNAGGVGSLGGFTAVKSVQRCTRQQQWLHEHARLAGQHDTTLIVAQKRCRLVREGWGGHVYKEER